jgi:uncharacterized protein YebE (UPF0316 family)
LDLTGFSPFLLVPLIVIARVGDVTLGTLRTIVLFRGYRILAAAFGFFEVLIWLVAAGQVFGNLDRWYLAVAYAAGFSLGNVVGSWLESKIAVGYQLLRVVSENRRTELARALREAGYRDIIHLAGFDADEDPVEVLLVVERRRRMPRLLHRIHQIDPQALWTVSDVQRQPDATLPWLRRVLASDNWKVTLKRK